jgi:polygalacturonase
MRHFEFALNISTLDYQHYYRGSINQVIASCADGKTVQFPAGLLTPFVSSGGVRGSFVLTCDDAGKGAALKRR